MVHVVYNTFYYFSTELTSLEVKQYICFLIQHNIVKFEEINEKIMYDVNIQYALDIIYFPKFLQFIKQKYGSTVQDMFLTLFFHGKCHLTFLLKTCSKDGEINYQELKNIINNLIADRYIKRSPWLDPNDINLDFMPKLTFNENFAFNLPPNYNFDYEIKTLLTQGMPTLKRFKQTHSLKMFWILNMSKIKNDLLSKILTNSFTLFYLKPYLSLCESDSELMRKLTTFPEKLFNLLSSNDSYQSMCSFNSDTLLKDENDTQTKYIYDNFISYLIKDWNLQGTSDFKNTTTAWIKPKGVTDKGGYGFMNSQGVTEIFQEFIFSYLTNKYNTNAARIYNLVKHRKCCEQKRIEERCMMAPKEAKENLYTLLGTGLLTIQEISKGTDFAPSRTFYLFKPSSTYESVQILWNHCSNIYINLYDRILKERESGKQLFEKRDKIEIIIANIPAGLEGNPQYEEQVENIRAALLPSEIKLMNEITDSMKKLRAARFNLTDLFVILDAHTSLNCNT